MQASCGERRCWEGAKAFLCAYATLLGMGGAGRRAPGVDVRARGAGIKSPQGRRQAGEDAPQNGLGSRQRMPRSHCVIPTCRAGPAALGRGQRHAPPAAAGLPAPVPHAARSRASTYTWLSSSSSENISPDRMVMPASWGAAVAPPPACAAASSALAAAPLSLRRGQPGRVGGPSRPCRRLHGSVAAWERDTSATDACHAPGKAILHRLLPAASLRAPAASLTPASCASGGIAPPACRTTPGGARCRRRAATGPAGPPPAPDPRPAPAGDGRAIIA